MSIPRLSVIVIGYNERKNLPDCLTSLYQSTYKNFKIIFVDNCSEDHSIKYVKQHFPEVKIIQNNKNYGFSIANNIGIKYAKKIKSQYVLILNPDTIIDKNCLSDLIKVSNKNTILQPLILLHKNKKTDLVNTAGNQLHYLGFSYCSGYKLKSDKFKQTKNIVSASGAGMLIPLEILDKIGGFDEIIYPYHEDLDLCWRARMAGFNIKLVPTAKIWHKYEFGRNKNKIYFVERNRILFILKNYELITILKLLPFAMMVEIMIICFSIKNRWLLKKIKSYTSIVIALPYVLKTRHKINLLRKKKDLALKSYFTASLMFDKMKIPFLNIFNKISKNYWRTINKLEK